MNAYKESIDMRTSSGYKKSECPVEYENYQTETKRTHVYITQHKSISLFNLFQRHLFNMASTTYSEFGSNTEGVEIAKAFPEGIHGKNVLITGVNRGGIAFSTAHALVSPPLASKIERLSNQSKATQAPALLILAGRSPAKVQDSIDALKSEFPDVKYRFLEVDLSSQKSVRKAAEELSDIPIIDIVINSAAVMGVQKRTLSEDGIELQLATNHLGHWLLTCLLIPKLIKAAEGKPKGSVRIVNITSASPMSSSMRWSDMNFEKKNKDLPQDEQPIYDLFKLWGYNNAKDLPYIPLDGYDRSKVANVLFSIGANKRLFEKYGILSVAAHPGVIMTTELPRHFPQETIEAATKLCEAGLYATKSVGAGASTGLVAALDPKLAVGVGETHEGSENYGTYLAECQISEKARSLAVSSSEAEKLWKFSEKVTGEDLQW